MYEDDGVLKLSELERMVRSKSMQIRRIRAPESEGGEVSDELGKAIAKRSMRHRIGVHPAEIMVERKLPLL